MADYQNSVPAYDRTLSIFTFQDAVERLLDLYGLKRTDVGSLRRVREAVLSAYRELGNRRHWSCYCRRMILKSVAAHTTGTVSYDHTGGSSERLLTFSSALPSWARWGKIQLSSVDYEIASAPSSLTATLKQHSNPGADVASTTFTLFRSLYTLPNELQEVVQILDVSDQTTVRPVPFRQLQWDAVVSYGAPDVPYWCVVRSAPGRYGHKALEFSPGTEEARSYDIAYLAQARPLQIEKYSAGTVSLTAGGTTVTLSGGTFPEDCVGAVIRFSADGLEEPTGVAGTADDIDNRYSQARVIQSRTSGTAVTIDQSISSAAVSAVRYTISDPLDIDYQVMLNALHALAEAEMAKRVRNKKEDESGRYRRDADREVRRAQEADTKLLQGTSQWWVDLNRRDPDWTEA